MNSLPHSVSHSVTDVSFICLICSGLSFSHSLSFLFFLFLSSSYTFSISLCRSLPESFPFLFLSSLISLVSLPRLLFFWSLSLGLYFSYPLFVLSSPIPPLSFSFFFSTFNLLLPQPSALYLFQFYHLSLSFFV